MAYAALFSLVQSLDELKLSHDFFDFKYDDQRLLIRSSYEKVSSLQSSIEKASYLPESMRQTLDDLESAIRVVIYKAQYSVDSFMLQLNLSSDDPQMSEEKQSLTLVFMEELRDLIVNVDPIMDKAEEILRAGKLNHGRSNCVDDLSELNCVFSNKSSEIVGHERNLEILKGMILKEDSRLVKVLISGMAAIGKTTLAKFIYDDPSIHSHFQTRAWVSVLTEYHETYKIATLVIRKESKDDDDASDAIKVLTLKFEFEPQFMDMGEFIELSEMLIKTKYLIVIDDVRDSDVWILLITALPDNANGSRTIVTTRNPGLCRLADPYDYELKDPFLNDDESWNLLRSVVFTSHEEYSCLPQLEKIGKNIAKNCEGLPPAIIEVGKILRETEKTVEKWKTVEEREHPVIISADDNTPLSKTLYLSYKQLPPYLKACFLYMGLFPKNTEIRTSKLIKLWVAEGFIKERWRGSLEYNAKRYLGELVNKSLVLVCQKATLGTITKTCRVHVVYRSLCTIEAWNDKFCHVINKLSANSFPQGMDSQQRLCFHNNIILGFKHVHQSLKSASAARSLLCLGPYHRYPIKVYFPFKVLRVLDGLTLRFYKFPSEVLELVRLRYLAITYDGELTPSISELSYLEVLIVHRHHIIKYADGRVNYLPKEIWNLRNLRHLDCMGSDLLDPSSFDDREDHGDGSNLSFVLHNLLTLSGVSAHSFTKGVLERLPKLRKLVIRIESAHDDPVETFNFFGNFVHDNTTFQVFKCVVVDRGLAGSLAFPFKGVDYPRFMRVLCLSGCGFSWEYFRCIVNLPYLEMLKLKCNAFRGPVWEIKHLRELPLLSFMLLEDLDIEHWEFSRRCFPWLRHLVIRHCYKLREIDDEIQELQYLKMIEVDDCSPAMEVWAREIREERLRSGVNDRHIQVLIHSSRDDKKRKS